MYGSALSTPSLAYEGTAILRSGSLPAGATNGLPEGGAVEIFAQVHEREERIEDAGLHFVGQVQSAGRGAGQHFAVLGDVTNNFYLAGVGSLPVHGFAAHFRTGLF